jgi:ribosome-binding factor A
MEHRNQQHRRERLGEALREEIGAILEGELGDPRIGLVSVTEVQMSPDGRSARVFVSLQDDDAAPEETVAGLQAARGYIKRQLIERLRLRHAPELFFQLDMSDQQTTRIDELLKRLNKRKK